MIYEENKPSFEDIINQLTALKERMNERIRLELRNRVSSSK